MIERIAQEKRSYHRKVKNLHELSNFESHTWDGFDGGVHPDEARHAVYLSRYAVPPNTRAACSFARLF